MAATDPMSEPPLCVCGHFVSIHTLMHGADRGCTGDIALPDGVTAWCPCHQCRPALDWPDEPGCYWIDGDVKDDDGNEVPAKFLVPCLAQQLLNRIVVIWDGKIYQREDWEGLFGPARFAKLLEQNPFPERKVTP